MLEAISWRLIRAFQHNTHTHTIHSRHCGIACERTLSRPFPCPSAPHPSRVRPKVSSSPPAVAFQNTAILQSIHATRPPSVQSPKAFRRLRATPIDVRTRSRETVPLCEKRWRVLAHSPGVQRANMPWPVQLIDPQEGALHGCVVVNNRIFVKLRTGERQSGQRANTGQRKESIKRQKTDVS